MKVFLVLLFIAFSTQIFSQSKFAQLDIELPTPNEYRNASGAPGHNYYQQKADYVIKLRLDDSKQTITGDELITYTNNSPDKLEFLWLQLDQNYYRKDADNKTTEVQRIDDFRQLSDVTRKMFEFDGGMNIDFVGSVSNIKMKYFINKTMMRIDLDQPLGSKQSITFRVKWHFNINDRDKVGGRSGLEYFPEEDNYLYTIAQFFPRMCVYNDVEGWQNKQFLGTGEFALPFGDYQVEITVPEDHLVAATGELQNASEVMTATQRNRLKSALNSDKPLFVVTPEEALQAEKTKKTTYKTWKFKALNVRDFAFASSRKFIWDAQGLTINGKKILAMSFYPKEGNPLWEKYSTKLVAHTLKCYSKYTVDYPYPVAISVHTKDMGMEYPMISFNGGRPEKDGTYSENTKYGMWGVIIHEVGHNFFPMIINSDERQWTWMDEGLNTFVQYLTEQEWERGYPSRRGPASTIVDYMRGDKANLSPIMINSESILQYGNNAYGKPAAALNILRETILGRELFDYAFKVYCNRWKFKHPTPADLFRTLEEASAVDLDWFWRGWFYTTDFVDIELSEVKHFTLNTLNPDIEKSLLKEKELEKQKHIGEIRNITSIPKTQNELDTTLNEFYNTRNKFAVDKLDKKVYEEKLAQLSNEEKALLKANYNFYEVSFNNVGGLVMPIILKVTYADKTEEIFHYPAEIWRRNDQEVSKVLITQKEIVSLQVDPYLETADCNLNNNSWPSKVEPTRFQLFINNKKTENDMQRAKRLDGLK